MKKLLIILTLFFIVVSGNARTTEKPLIEIGPKTTLYMDHVYQFGIGGEAVVNPLRNVGFRFNLIEIIFDPTTLYLNREGSVDALIFLPLRNINFQLYFHSGISLTIYENEAGTQTRYSIRGGMGLNCPLNPKTCLFVEPGITILGNGETEIPLRLSAGARLGIID
jgi:hypothetical protein